MYVNATDVIFSFRNLIFFFIGNFDRLFSLPEYLRLAM
jgi:hypothetical protein